MCALWYSLGTSFHGTFQEVALAIMITARRPLRKFSGVTGKSLIERWGSPRYSANFRTDYAQACGI